MLRFIARSLGARMKSWHHSKPKAQFSIHSIENGRLDNTMTLALEGKRVLDSTDEVAGPYTTMLLSRCGAEVIRIESRRHLGFRESSKKGRGNAGASESLG